MRLNLRFGFVTQRKKMGFGERVHSIFTGLFKDATNDGTYDIIKVIYDHYHTLDEDLCEEVFTENLDKVAECLKAKNTETLLELLLGMTEDEMVRGALRTIHASFPNEGMFKKDTKKKFLKRLQKLVYSIDPPTAVTSSAKPNEEDEYETERCKNFNEAYREFLVHLSEKIEGGGGDVLEVFDDITNTNKKSVIEPFREYVLPYVPEIMKGLQSKDFEQQKEILSPYFGTDPAWINKLPLLFKFNIDSQKWIAYREKNSMEVMKSVGNLLSCMTGLNCIINSPVVSHLQKRAVEIMQREKMGAQDFLPNSPSFNQTNLLSFAQELLQSIPEATNGEISHEDVSQLISHLITGAGDIPDSFEKVFNPAIIDLDCIGILAELPGLGPVIAPLVASSQGQMQGHTGAASPFGNVVENPAWLNRD